MNMCKYCYAYDDGRVVESNVRGSILIVQRFVMHTKRLRGHRTKTVAGIQNYGVAKRVRE
jgi:hypothetical protein